MGTRIKLGNILPKLKQTSFSVINVNNKSGSFQRPANLSRCLNCLGIQHRAIHTLSVRTAGYGINTLPQAPQKDVDNFSLVKNDIVNLFAEIRQEVGSRSVLRELATYHFDGQGKCLRPMIALLMSRAVNTHICGENRLMKSQKEVAKIIEMIHVASLLHDDVIDGSDRRRGKPTVHSRYSHRQAVMGGDYILSVAATMLARLRHEAVLTLLAQILVDLVQGEFMQLGSKENEDERFAHYLKKTFNKTASLIAYSCKAVAVLSGVDEATQEIAFQYGKNCGIAFQLVDDVLDFTPTDTLGKPNFSDLKSGIATAPVLFACEKFPELNTMIMRRFQDAGDFEKALDFVYKSNGLEQTRFLAQKHCQEAIKQISSLKDSAERQDLILITGDIINRNK